MADGLSVSQYCATRRLYTSQNKVVKLIEVNAIVHGVTCFGDHIGSNSFQMKYLAVVPNFG